MRISCTGAWGSARPLRCQVTAGPRYAGRRRPAAALAAGAAACWPTSAALAETGGTLSMLMFAASLFPRPGFPKRVAVFGGKRAARCRRPLRSQFFPHCPAPRLLGAVQTAIRHREQVGRIGVPEAVVADRGSYRRRDRDRLSLKHHRRGAQALENPLNRDLDLAGPAAHAQGHELVAAVAGQHVVRPQAPLELRGHVPQDLIAQRVAVAVVDRLEVVQVDDDQSHAAPRALRPAPFLLETPLVGQAVHQARQRIADAAAEHLAHVPPAKEHVVPRGDADEAIVLHDGRVVQGPGHRRRRRRAVGGEEHADQTGQRHLRPARSLRFVGRRQPPLDLADGHQSHQVPRVIRGQDVAAGGGPQRQVFEQRVLMHGQGQRRLRIESHGKAGELHA